MKEYPFVQYLVTIFDKVFAAHDKSSLDLYKEIAEEVKNYTYPDDGTNHLNVLKSFLVATKNFPGEEQQKIRAEIKKDYYIPLAKKLGIATL